jgi:hypothetical protein
MKRKIENDKRAEEREYSLAGVGRGGGWGSQLGWIVTVRGWQA